MDSVSPARPTNPASTLHRRAAALPVHRIVQAAVSATVTDDPARRDVDFRTGSRALKLRFLPVVFLAFLMAFPMTVLGSLRTLGRIEQVGLASENVLELGVLLEGCEWDAVASSDGGRTWRLARRATLPGTLAPLPAKGEIRYQMVDYRLLLRSDDSGATWSDVSPWQFLSLAVRQDVETEKKRFLFRYGHWLPQEEAWPFTFAGSAAVLLSIAGLYSRNLQGGLWAPVALSIAAYGLFGLGLFAVHGWSIHWLCSDQWTYRLGHWDGGISFPKWPLGVLLHLTGNAWFAPVTATALFPATPLWGRILSGPLSARRAPWPALASGVPVLCLLILIAVSCIPDVGRGWDYAIEATGNGEEDDPANESQPIRAEANRMSSAPAIRE